jgi:hypothetical protein
MRAGSGDCPTMSFGVPETITFFEVTGSAWLSTQSPSQRCDGDCALSRGRRIASETRCSPAHHKALSDPAAAGPLPVGRR